jgi:5-formyltetrahydrofolate cyclo-ligase
MVDLADRWRAHLRRGGRVVTFESKSAWRRWATLLQRPPTWEEQEGIVGHLEARLRSAQSLVLVFQSMPHEIDLAPLVNALGAERCCTTRTPSNGPLTMHSVDNDMESHRFGFDQPRAGSPVVDPMSIDVALVPGVLFATDGARLGHGKGYYDRLLAACRPEVERLAVTRSDLIVSELPVEAHDIVMTHLATEVGIARCG